MSKKILITSALPYVNNVPHLGNIIGSVLSADVFARFSRSIGKEVLYICGTDEYGTATENKARQENLTEQEICDKYHKIHQAIYEHFQIKFDYFGRTSTPEHTEITQSIYENLNKNHFLVEQESEQTYCEHDAMFLADRYVEGICPHCEYKEARGDQCDACGKLLQPTELKSPKCNICGNPPITRKTKHLYLDLPKIEQKLVTFQKESMKKGNWSKNAISITNSWIQSGLAKRPITRDLKWGVPVPKKGYEKKVFYVWFDAVIGYISNTKKGFPSDWQTWWKNPENTELYQFMAKDNVPFHTVIFPACLIGSHENWTLLHHINSTEYLNYENDKFSKSRNIGVFGTDVIDSNIPVDLWRFYLLYNRPEKADTNFTWDSFVEEINSNFIDNIGNLQNRVFVFFNKHFKNKIGLITLDSKHKVFLKELQEKEQQIVTLLENVSLKEGLKQILSLGKIGNKFFQDQTPWIKIKTEPLQVHMTLTVLLYLIHDIAILLGPYMPKTKEKLLDQFNIKHADFTELGNWDYLQNQEINKPAILYSKLDPTLSKEMKYKFSGIQNNSPVEKWNKLQIKVGKIISVNKHPNAERLYIETIDCGEGFLRTVVSGLVEHISQEDLLEKKVLVVTNLKPANIRSVQSEGMLLVAENKKQLEVLTFEDAKIGSIVHLQDNPIHSHSKELISIDSFFETQILVCKHQLLFENIPLCIDQKELKTNIVENGKVK